MISRLAVFDFDDTLFRSPWPPADWGEDEHAWWSSVQSLSPPYVPQVPKEPWWNLSVLRDAKQALRDPSSYVILLTGREKEYFEHRVKEIISQEGLDFHEVHLRGLVESTPEFKMSEILRTVENNPTISLVEMWDDLGEFLARYKAYVESLGLRFRGHLIRESPLGVVVERYLANQFG